MSNAVLTAVWAKSRHSKGALLLMVALADQGNDQGYSFPSQRTLAHKARMTERNASRLINEVLIPSGELEIIEPGRGHRHTTYRVRVDQLGPPITDEDEDDGPPTQPVIPRKPRGKKLTPGEGSQPGVSGNGDLAPRSSLGRANASVPDDAHSGNSRPAVNVKKSIREGKATSPKKPKAPRPLTLKQIKPEAVKEALALKGFKYTLTPRDAGAINKSPASAEAIAALLVDDGWMGKWEKENRMIYVLLDRLPKYEAYLAAKANGRSTAVASDRPGPTLTRKVR